jgi:aromatic-L-amino-acid decarboxylase
MPNADPPHMTPEQFQRLGHRMVDWIVDYMRRVETLPVGERVEPGEIASYLPEAPPEKPGGEQEWDTIFSDLSSIIEPGLTHWQSPNFFGYFPANATGPAILAELLSAGLGVQGMLWSTSPACTEVETRMLDWMARASDLPPSFLSDAPDAGGVIQGTASEAVLVALVAARAVVKSPAGRLRLYTSSQAHSSVVKAAMIAGLGRESVRLIDVDESLAMKPDALAAAVDADRQAGDTPFFVCATVGTTSSTAVDPVRPIGQICKEQSLWLHVDAAYAGAACVCPEHRSLIDGVELADTYNFNPHKWMLTNFDCSLLWTRRRSALLEALSITPEYLRNRASEAGGVIDYRDWQIPLGRRFRALKLWFVMRHYGLEGVRAHIRRGVSLAERFESFVRDDDRFELAAPRPLSLVCFRLRAGDEVNRTLLETLNASGRLLLTHTSLPTSEGDRYTLRMAIGGVRTEQAHVDEAWRLICETADRVLVAQPAGGASAGPRVSSPAS